ncbi:AAA domain-containing protein [Rozella allomycis CSF55]|uniref:DNA replication ATP-dependent helicase/nuclease n=1 Tax=Rozella allomycis (strain CSF55) TaxID=988480 RepID=A0A075ANB9_ROZAC|nr:AAA domain-containing protein [Rozella allomycis CSF55]|eukprot:EPZ31330.1 AAA domain-containing protein [Rozella allomycis CSF55]
MDYCIEDKTKISGFGRFKCKFRGTRKFTESVFNVGDPIVISVSGKFSIAIGYATVIDKESFECFVDRNLNKYTNNTFRIDKDELSSGWSSVRNNLVQLLMKEEKLKRLIADLEKPIFSLNKTINFTNMHDDLNLDQKEAIKRVIQAEDYVMLLGMPGTGKSTLIAHLVSILINQGKSVLITGYTHSSVDNILLKLKQLNLDFLRLGNSEKIDPGLIDYVDPNFNSLDEINKFYSTKKIVACTCLGIFQHPIFKKRKFDVCIVDEASQVTLPVCIGPLLHSNKFVLVGDHYQLSPLTRSSKNELSKSLFKRLCEAHPNNISRLSFQYRMNSDISLLSNHLFYNFHLKCGNEKIANQSLKIYSNCFCNSNCFIQLVCQSNVLFLNTDTIGLNLEQKQGDSIVNHFEASLVNLICKRLVYENIDKNRITVLSPFRSQCKLFDCEASTIDKYQGKDNDVIIASLVRSNDQSQVKCLFNIYRLEICLNHGRD